MQVKKIIEYSGSFILIVVIIAIANADVGSKSALFPLMMGIGIMLVNSVLRTQLTLPTVYLQVSALLCLAAGGYYFLFYPQYFSQMHSSILSFWYRACLYSLPAICIEGGVLTLVTVLQESDSQCLTTREKKFLYVGFISYAIIAIAVNFMALGNVIQVQTHIAFTKAVLIALIAIATIVGVKNRYNL
jgi:hypothetical protein